MSKITLRFLWKYILTRKKEKAVERFEKRIAAANRMINYRMKKFEAYVRSISNVYLKAGYDDKDLAAFPMLRFK